MRVYFILEYQDETRESYKWLLQQIKELEAKGQEVYVLVPYIEAESRWKKEIRNLYSYDESIGNTWMSWTLGRMSGLGRCLRQLPEPDVLIGTFFPNTCLYIRACVGENTPIYSLIEEEADSYSQGIYLKYALAHLCISDAIEESIYRLLKQEIVSYRIEPTHLAEAIIKLSDRRA